VTVPWKLAPALAVLQQQINARAPDRSRAADGTIGDAAHQAQGSASDHNPHVVIAGQPYVTAVDITHDPAGGLDCHWLRDALLRAGKSGDEPRIKYLIFNDVLYDSRAVDGNDYTPWKPQYGYGHTHHLHLSIMGDLSLLDRSPWNLDGLVENREEEGDMFLFVGVWDAQKKTWGSDLALLHGPHFTGGFTMNDVIAMRADPANGHIPLMGVSAERYHDMRKKGDLLMRQAEAQERADKRLEEMMVLLRAKLETA